MISVLQERLGVPDKEWEKFRVSFVILGKPHYVEEDDKTVNTKVKNKLFALQSEMFIKKNIPRS